MNYNPNKKKPGDDWLLHRGIKSLLQCDEAEVVRGIARYVISQYGILKSGESFVERRRQTFVAPTAAFLGAVTRFLEVRPGNNDAGSIVWVARLENERRALEPALALMPEILSTELILRRSPKAKAILSLFHRLIPERRRLMKLARRLLRRDEPFFKVLRVAEMIGYYAHYLHIFRQNEFKLALMSSHSNPHGIAFNLAARRCGVPVVLITHGMPVRPIARLSYDLAVVHCEIARRRYAEAGSQIKRAIIHGRRQDYRPMPEGPMPETLSVGIFLCKDVNEQRLIGLTKHLLEDRQVKEIIIRPHPKNLWRGFSEWVASLNDPRARASAPGPAAGDLKSTDIVLGGNSSVLIEAVTGGQPAAYVAGLDYGSPDLHELVKEELIYQFDDQKGLDPESLLSFYRRPEWCGILKEFANIDETESDIYQQLRKAVIELIEDTDFRHSSEK